MADSKLSALQRDFLRAFFQREQRFFLTGGGALAGFHLGHRETHDLDLFTLEDAMTEGMAFWLTSSARYYRVQKSVTSWTCARSKWLAIAWKTR